MQMISKVYNCVDAIIPNYNGKELIACYMPVIKREIKESNIIFVDDASIDGSMDFFQKQFPNARAVSRHANGGFSRAVNDGIRISDSEFIAVLNNDVELTPGFLNSILQLFGDESVFSVSPRILLPSKDNLDEGCKTGFWHHGLFYTDQRQGIDQVTPVLYTTACAAIYRRSMLKALGGFEEAYSPFYWEDIDLGYRAWKRGWKSLYQPASTVYHQHSASISKLKKSRTDRVKARNSLFFIWRNITDSGLIARHRRFLAFVLLKRLTRGDSAFVSGWADAFARRSEATSARDADEIHRQLSDREIFQIAGIKK